MTKALGRVIIAYQLTRGRKMKTRNIEVTGGLLGTVEVDLEPIDDDTPEEWEAFGWKVVDGVVVLNTTTCQIPHA